MRRGRRVAPAGGGIARRSPGVGRFLEPDALSEDPTHPPTGATAAYEPESQPHTDLLTGAFHPEPSQDAPPAGPGAGATPRIVIAGRYMLVEMIGEGGMGSVYLAEQTEPVKRQVALKLIKGGTDSRAVLARFEAERQALALMDHPNIARVYDGGTTEQGQPFFVMELVRGIPLTEFCDQKRLSVRARLELFVSVCQAVQHAHQKGIIHRDLKPGNVLVTEVDGRPTPKVIDFGVAKATEVRLTDLSYADTGAVVGTPAYMSPEQADPSSMDIDTRTDVYALGVMLYELLVGSPPLDARQFKRGAILEMLRMVREVDPPRPSTKLSAADDLPNIAANRNIEPAKLAKSLRGELDWVVMKALEKDRTRRYDSPNAFAHDVQRYLADEVVGARPPSAGYRLRKFVRRHKGPVIAASLVLITLVGGIVASSLFAVEANFQAKKAKDNEKKANDNAQEAKDNEQEAKDNEKLATYRLGVSHMLLADEAYDKGNVTLAAEWLEKVPREQRGWEWRYKKQETRGGLFTIYGNPWGFTSVAFSPDGTRILTGGGDPDHPGEVRLWDARTGEFLFELKGVPPLNGWPPSGSPFPSGWEQSASFSPDGTRILTAGAHNKTARMWNAQTGAPLPFELKEYQGVVWSAAFSPDGKRVVTSCADETARVWNAETGALLLELKPHRFGVDAVAFSPDGKRIATVSGDSMPTVKVWDAEKGGPALLDLKGITSGEGTVAFSPDSKRIITGRSDGTATVVDAQTGETVLELKGHARSYGGGAFRYFGVLDASFSPDGMRIVTVGGVGAIGGHVGEAIVWDARTGKELLALKGHTARVMRAAFSPDATQIVTGSGDGTAKVWDARTGTPRVGLYGHKGVVNSLAFSPDGTRIVTGGDEVWVWEARTRTPVVQLKGVKGIVQSVAFSPDGKRIVTGGDETGGDGARVWDAETGEARVHLKGIKEGVDGVAFSPDGTRIVTTGSAGNRPPSELKVWDARTGEALLDLTPKGITPEGWRGDQRGCVAFSPDGTRFVTGGIQSEEHEADTATVRDTETGKVLFELGHGRGISSLAYSPDGTLIVTCGGFGMIKVWNARTGKLLPLALKGHKGEVRSVTFSADADSQRIVTGGGDGSVRVWDAQTGTSLLDLKGYQSPIESVAVSPDGTRIVAVERDDLRFSVRRSDKPRSDTVRVWDARPGKLPLELKGPTDGIKDLAFSPDGTRIVTSGFDKTAKVWDTGTGTLQLELKGHAGLAMSASFSLDGTRIVTSSDDKRTKVWDAGTGQELPGEAIPSTAPNKRISPDGRLFAFRNLFTGGRFTNEDSADAEIVPWKLDDEERAYRQILTRPELWRYREGYESARVALDEFAARFYIQRLPPAERPVLEAQFGWERELAAGRERDAVPHLAILSAASPNDVEMAMKVAALQAWFGQDEAYTATCARSLAFAKDPKGARFRRQFLSDPDAMQIMVRICCVRLTEDKARQEAVLALARKAVELDNQNGFSAIVADLWGTSAQADAATPLRLALASFRLSKPGGGPKNVACLLALGMAEYRSGHFAEAEAALIAAKDSDLGAFYRAMSLYRQGKKDEARKVATEAAAILRNVPLPRDETKPLEGGHRFILPNALFTWLTYKEAKALIGFDEAPPPEKK